VARAASAEPTLPPAPALLSTTTGLFQLLPNSAATTRAAMSAVPPAGKGTMILTSRSG